MIRPLGRLGSVPWKFMRVMMESHAIDMRNSVFGHAFALAVLSVACVGTLRADTPTPAAEVAEFRLAPNLAWRYGAWVAKGPRIVSDSGEPLEAARVVELAVLQEPDDLRDVGVDGAALAAARLLAAETAIGFFHNMQRHI